MPKRRITANGDVVIEDDSNITANANTSDNNMMMSSLFGNSSSSSDRIDVFGFSLEKKQCIIFILFSFFILGPRATFGLVIAWGLYRIWAESTSNTTSGLNPSSLSGGGGGGGSTTTTDNNHWSSRVGRGGNIRGISDLPCDPRRG